MPINSVPISSIMTTEVEIVQEDQSIKSAANVTDTNNIGGIVIVGKDNTPTGMITERDIVKLVSHGSVSFEQPLKSEMKTPVATADVMMSLEDALQTMQNREIRRLP